MAHGRTGEGQCALLELSGELLLMVLEFLDKAALASLARCNRKLLAIAEPVLYNTELRRDEALLWACWTNNVQVLRKAAHFGAEITAPISVLNPNSSGSDVKTERILSLRAASMCGYLEAFRTLLELGASLDVPGRLQHEFEVSLVEEIDLIICFLSTCQDLVPVLTQFFTSSVVPSGGDHSRGMHYLQRCAEFALADDARPSLITFEALLSITGPPGPIDVRFLQSRESISPCPVAIAILEGRLDLMERLLSMGASVEGKKMPRLVLPTRCSDVPIFAAASLIQRDGLQVVRRLAALGANVNRRARISRGSGGKNYIHAEHPVCVYLATVENWDISQSPTPTEVLQFFFDHGLVLNGNKFRQEKNWETNWDNYCRFSGPLEPWIMKIMEGWGDTLSDNAEFNAVVEMVMTGNKRQDLDQVSEKAH
ncbi:hypothetical protein NLG97_g3261 [Lecanicillium saksenae]|uniref:Uncharacterized protein n=1 Tax=Lecanicillium saksenae TaxID=468837 RepID=A0ACC1R2L0_9HYPO|nr:hypothetical protein NLG97_g3261 [Lecanicillium saksenae]